MSNKKIKLIAAASLIAGLIYFFQRAQDTQPKRIEPPSEKSSVSENLPKSIPVATSLVVPAWGMANAKDIHVLSPQELSQRFSLTAIDSFKLNNAIRAIEGDLRELKGMGARIQSYDGKNLVLELPELDIDDTGLTTIAMGALSSALGTTRSEKLWQDPEGRKTVLQLAGIDLVSQKSTYHFTLISAENNPSINGSTGYARFDVSWNYSSTKNGELAAIPPQRFTGFTIADAANAGLGKSAINRAPEGYFHSGSFGTSSVAAPIVIED